MLMMNTELIVQPVSPHTRLSDELTASNVAETETLHQILTRSTLP